MLGLELKTSTIIGFGFFLVLVSIALATSLGSININQGGSSSVSLNSNTEIVEDVKIVGDDLRVQWDDIAIEHQNAESTSVETTIEVETSDVTESPRGDTDLGLGSPPEQVSVAQTNIVTSDGTISVSEDHTSPVSLSNNYEFGNSIVDVTRDGRVSLILKFTISISDTEGIDNIENQEVSRFVSFEAESLGISDVIVDGSLGANAEAPP